jgi:hypothetical protein
MPRKGQFLLSEGVIEVATRYGLRADIPRALRRHGPMTAPELSNYLYWNRTPRNSRLGAKWSANWSQKSATRRAIAVLLRHGKIVDGGRLGRKKLYQLDQPGGR